MKRVIKYQTIDGKLHDTIERAEHYADVVYTQAVSKLAGTLVGIDRYQAVKQFIDENLASFVALQALKDDCVFKCDPDDD